MATALERIQQARQRQQLGRVASLGIGAYQGATFNFGDELAGIGAALIPGGRGYTEGRDAVRDAYANARPGYRIAGEIAGSLAVPIGAGGQFIARGAGAAAQAGRAALVGAGQGAVAGVGAGDGGAGDRVLSGIEGAAMGAALGGGAQATLARLTRARARRVAPGAAEAQARGIRLTRGQYTGDLEQLSREQELLGIRGAGGDTVRAYLEGQAQDVAGELERTAGRLGAGGDVTGNARDFVGGLQGAEREADRAVGEAYRVVRQETRGQVGTAGAERAARDLAERFRRTIHDNVEGIGLNPETGDHLQQVAERLLSRSGMLEAANVNRAEQALQRAQQSGRRDAVELAQATLDDARQALERRAPTIQRVEGLRQGLNKVYRGERDPQRRAGLQRMIGDFDDWLGQTVTRGLMTGDDQLVERLRNARGLARHYHSLFGTGGRESADRAADNLMQSLINEQAGPDDAIRFVQRLSQTGGKGIPQVLERIERASPEAFNMMRAAHFQNQLVNQRTGRELTPARIASNLRHLTDRQPDFARRLYGPEGVRDMRGLASALEATDRQLAASGNASRSGFTVANLTRRFGRLAGLAGAFVGGNPQVAFTTLLTEGLSNVESLAQATKATRPVPRAQIIPPLARQAIANVGRAGPGVANPEPERPQAPIDQLLANPSAADPQTLQTMVLAEMLQQMRQGRGGEMAPQPAPAAPQQPMTPQQAPEGPQIDPARLEALERQQHQQLQSMAEMVELNRQMHASFTDRVRAMEAQAERTAERPPAIPTDGPNGAPRVLRRRANARRDDEGNLIGVDIEEEDEQGRRRTRRAQIARDAFGRFVGLTAE